MRHVHPDTERTRYRIAPPRGAFCPTRRRRVVKPWPAYFRLSSRCHQGAMGLYEESLKQLQNLVSASAQKSRRCLPTSLFPLWQIVPRSKNLSLMARRRVR
jgi:hypothetical protein